MGTLLCCDGMESDSTVRHLKDGPELVTGNFQSRRRDSDVYQGFDARAGSTNQVLPRTDSFKLSSSCGQNLTCKNDGHTETARNNIKAVVNCRQIDGIPRTSCTVADNTSKKWHVDNEVEPFSPGQVIDETDLPIIKRSSGQTETGQQYQYMKQPTGQLGSTRDNANRKSEHSQHDTSIRPARHQQWANRESEPNPWGNSAEQMGQQYQANRALEHGSRGSSTSTPERQPKIDKQVLDQAWEIRQLKSDLAKMKEQNQHLHQQLIYCQDERENLRKRLSEYLSNKVTDNNPNIANLGDRNRPEKLTGRFSELYDNQWSDAFEYLNEEEQMSETEAIQYILEVLKLIFSACEGKAQDQLIKMRRAIKEMTGTDEIPDNMSTHMKLYKEERKKNFASVLPHIRNMVVNTLKNNSRSVHLSDNAFGSFIEEATELCWLMCIQDPPMALETDCQPGDRVDTKKFKHYTQTGKKVAYLVWPAVCLYKSGPVIAKGIVQGKKSRKKSYMSGTHKSKNEGSGTNEEGASSPPVHTTQHIDFEKTQRVIDKDGQPVDFLRQDRSAPITVKSSLYTGSLTTGSLQGLAATQTETANRTRPGRRFSDNDQTMSLKTVDTRSKQGVIPQGGQSINVSSWKNSPPKVAAENRFLVSPRTESPFSISVIQSETRSRPETGSRHSYNYHDLTELNIGITNQNLDFSSDVRMEQ